MITLTRPIELSRPQALRQKLEAQRQQLREAAHAAKQTIKDDRSEHAGLVVDLPEESDADVRDDVDLALFAIQSELLLETERALTQLDAGTYGLCSVCGTEIAAERLAALPSATRCWPCEAEHEAETIHASAIRARRLARELTGLRRTSATRTLKK